jgi:hypothetical protein
MRKAGKQERKLSFPAFLISSFKKLAVSQDLGTTPRRTGKTEGAEAWRLPLCLALKSSAFGGTGKTLWLRARGSWSSRPQNSRACVTLWQPAATGRGQAAKQCSITPALRKAIILDAARPLAQTHPLFLAQYQALGKIGENFPSLGKTAGFFSNHWKTGAAVLQRGDFFARHT